MIKENELRLNNLVTDEWYDSFKTIIKVDSINEKGINLKIIDDGNWAEIAQRWIKPEYEFNSIFPIPLTEEWLIKFGFNSQYKKGWIGIDVKHSNGTTTDFVLSYPQRMGMWQTFFAFEYDGFRFVEIKYVHQLQNIYFALTNKELELIKE